MQYYRESEPLLNADLEFPKFRRPTAGWILLAVAVVVTCSHLIYMPGQHEVESRFAALALLPLVIKGNVPGHEIEYPMAVVILGGLATSTLLNLFLMPSLYSRFGRSRAIPDAMTRSDTANPTDKTAAAMASANEEEAVRGG